MKLLCVGKLPIVEGCGGQWSLPGYWESLPDDDDTVYRYGHYLRTPARLCIFICALHCAVHLHWKTVDTTHADCAVHLHWKTVDTTHAKRPAELRSECTTQKFHSSAHFIHNRHHIFISVPISLDI